MDIDFDGYRWAPPIGPVSAPDERDTAQAESRGDLTSDDMPDGVPRTRPVRAIRIGDGEPVAIKVFDSGESERAQREADIARAIDHPHIVRAIDMVVGTDAVGLVFPWMAGGSLADLVAVRRRLRWPETLTVLIPLADALAAAHERGLVHGDVSAGNVLFDGAGRPMLADFGASRAATETGAEVRVTPQDVAPEIVRGAVPGPASDLFSLGSVALMCLTGTAAWPADDLQDVLIQSAAGQWPELHENMAPQPLRALVRRILQPEPDDRGTAAQLAVDLRRVGDPEPVLLVGGFDGIASTRLGAATVVRPDALRPPSSQTQPTHRNAWVQRAWVRCGWVRRGWTHGIAAVARHLSWRGAAATAALIVLVVGAVGIGTWWGGGPAAATPSRAALAVPEDTHTSETSTELGAGRASPVQPVPPAPTAESGPDWARIVADLDAARSAAFVARDATLLDAVYTSDSPTRELDEQRITSLQRHSVRPHDARHRVKSVHVIGSVFGGSASLAVVEDRPETAIFDDSGELVGYLPAASESRIVMHVATVGGEFRVSHIEAG